MNIRNDYLSTAQSTYKEIDSIEESQVSINNYLKNLGLSINYTDLTTNPILAMSIYIHGFDTMKVDGRKHLLTVVRRQLTTAETDK